MREKSLNYQISRTSHYLVVFFSAELVNKQPHTIELACYMKCGMVLNPGFNFSKSPKRKLGELVFEKHIQ